MFFKKSGFFFSASVNVVISLDLFPLRHGISNSNFKPYVVIILKILSRKTCPYNNHIILLQMHIYLKKKLIMICDWLAVMDCGTIDLRINKQITVL